MGAAIPVVTQPQAVRPLNALLDRLPNLRLDPDFPVLTVTGLNSRAPRAVHVLFDAH